MNRQKGTRPGADTPRRAMMEAGTGQATTSMLDSTTPAQIGQIERLLSVGAANGVNLRHLVAMTRLSEREIRAEIQRERLAGIPILSDNLSGYFLPGAQDEVDRFIRSMRHRAREILETANAVERNGGAANG